MPARRAGRAITGSRKLVIAFLPVPTEMRLGLTSSGNRDGQLKDPVLVVSLGVIAPEAAGQGDALGELAVEDAAR